MGHRAWNPALALALAALCLSCAAADEDAVDASGSGLGGDVAEPTDVFLPADEDAVVAPDVPTEPDAATDAAFGPDLGGDEPDLSSSPDAAFGPDLATGPDLPLPADAPSSPDVEAAPDVSATTIDPAVFGSLAVTKHEVEVQSAAAGGRAFAVDLWLPEGSDALPLLVFSPAFQLGKESYVTLGEHVASHGVVVVVPSFGDGAFSPIDHRDLAEHVSAFLDWALAGADGRLDGRIDADRIVLGGHSRGGKVALLAAIGDARVDATFTVDPVDAIGNPMAPPDPTPENPSVAPELMPGYDVPGAMIGAGRGGEGFVPCAPADENYEQYMAGVTVSPFYLYEIATAGHLDFAENVGLLALGCPAGDAPEAHRAFAITTLTAFLGAEVAGDARYLPWLTGDSLPTDVTLTVR